MEDTDTALLLEVPADCAFIPIANIDLFVEGAIRAYVRKKHGGEGADAVRHAEEGFGYNDESLDPENIRRAIQERRAAGQMVVYEKDGFGVIRDDDVMRGTLKRVDFARMLAEEWNIAIRELSQGGPLAETPSVQSQDAETAAVSAPVEPAAGLEYAIPAGESEGASEGAEFAGHFDIAARRLKLQAEHAALSGKAPQTVTEHKTKREELEFIEDALRVLDEEVAAASAEAQASGKAPAENKAARQDRRLCACESAGLTMPESPMGRMPDGIGRVAQAEGVTRQAFTEDLRAALKRRAGATREGSKHRIE